MRDVCLNVARVCCRHRETVAQDHGEEAVMLEFLRCFVLGRNLADVRKVWQVGNRRRQLRKRVSRDVDDVADDGCRVFIAVEFDCRTKYSLRRSYRWRSAEGRVHGIVQRK